MALLSGTCRETATALAPACLEQEFKSSVTGIPGPFLFGLFSSLLTSPLTAFSLHWPSWVLEHVLPTDHPPWLPLCMHLACMDPLGFHHRFFLLSVGCVT